MKKEVQIRKLAKEEITKRKKVGTSRARLNSKLENRLLCHI